MNTEPTGPFPPDENGCICPQDFTRPDCPACRDDLARERLRQRKGLERGQNLVSEDENRAARIFYLEQALTPGTPINAMTTFYEGKGEEMRAELEALKNLHNNRTTK